MQLSVVIPAWNEAESLDALLPELRESLDRLRIAYEVIVVDGGSRDNSAEICAKWDARFLRQVERGYGGALLAGFAAVRGEFVLTMDADGSHPPAVAENMWSRRDPRQVIIGSRYVDGAGSAAEPTRKALSFILNRTYGLVLRIPARDLSSGFRMYPRAAVNLQLESRDFDVLEEIIALQHFQGYRILEVPFQYRPRRFGASHARVFAFGIAYCKTLYRLWSRKPG